MRTFANLFLFFFVVDGGLSTLDDLLALTFGIEGLAPLRNLNAIATLLLAVPLFFALGFDRRLPKRIFLPLLVFLLWTTAGCWPLAGLVSLEQLTLLASLLQLLLGILVLVYLRLRNGSSLQLRESDFTGETFSLINTLGYFAATLLILPFILGYLGLAMISQQIDEQTAGFMRVSPTGLYMKERTYANGDQQVRLTGMIHIGEQDYYRELAASMENQRTLVLAEGVSDEQGLLKSRFDYANLSSSLGLVSQQEMDIEGKVVEIENLAANDWSDAQLEQPHIAAADIDLSAFAPKTIEFLNVLGKVISGEDSFQESFALYNAWIEENMSPKLYDAIMADIVDKRNEIVINHLATALAHYDTIVVPWGAMHMPALEAAVLEQGFTLSAETERLSLDFRHLPYGEMLRRIGKQNAESPDAAVSEHPMSKSSD